MNKNRTLFLVEHHKNNKEAFAITKDISVQDESSLLDLLSKQNITTKFRLPIVTDAFEYQGKDQVIPLQPEQIFFMDYVDLEDIKGKSILEIGLGSGVLSIFCLLKGAKRGIGLDINPRAKIFTGFNAMVNGVADDLEIRDGNVEDIFAPVAKDTFDFIFSNPPFEPTPPDMDYYFNSAAGIYGLTFVEALLKGVDGQLNKDGVFEMVTMAPGNVNDPFMLYELIDKYLPNTEVEVILDHQPIRYDDFVDRFVDIFQEDAGKITEMKQIAQNDSVTHCHMLILKYKKGVDGTLKVRRSQKVYETWDSPLGTAVSMTEVMS